MKSFSAVYDHGKLAFQNPPSQEGPIEVVVVFPDVEDGTGLDPYGGAGDKAWEKIINDPTDRPALQSLAEQVRKDFKAGKCKPLDLDKL